jgi:hypothetical protein
MRRGLCEIRESYYKLHLKYYNILRYRVRLLALLAERPAMCL